MSDNADRVAELEYRLLEPETRADSAELGRLLDDSFIEIGKSGRVWSRAEIIEDLLADPTLDGLEVFDLRARHVTADVVLVTYNTMLRGRSAHRSSWWCHRRTGWRCVFHQGTPISDP